MSNQERIFTELKESICATMADLDPQLIHPQESLRQLGTNSLDRAMILMQTMENLNVRIPMIQFADASNIAEIVAIFGRAMPAAN